MRFMFCDSLSGCLGVLPDEFLHTQTGKEMQRALAHRIFASCMIFSSNRKMPTLRAPTAPPHSPHACVRARSTNLSARNTFLHLANFCAAQLKRIACLP